MSINDYGYGISGLTHKEWKPTCRVSPVALHKHFSPHVFATRFKSEARMCLHQLQHIRSPTSSPRPNEPAARFCLGQGWSLQPGKLQMWGVRQITHRPTPEGFLNSFTTVLCSGQCPRSHLHGWWRFDIALTMWLHVTGGPHHQLSVLWQSPESSSHQHCKTCQQSKYLSIFNRGTPWIEQ